ncbi:MAG: fibronectin type III domain-containing protein [Planctomycetota bacterium]
MPICDAIHPAMSPAALEPLEPRQLLSATPGLDQLHIGNSHIIGVTDALDLLVADAGITGHSTDQANIGGSTLKTHYFNQASTGLPQKATTPPKDVVSMQLFSSLAGEIVLPNRSPFGSPPEVEAAAAREFYLQVLAANPNATAFLNFDYSRWDYFGTGPTETAPNIDLFISEIYEPALDQLVADFPDREVYAIPVGPAFQALEAAIDNGELPGITSLVQLYVHDNNPADREHLTEEGQYFSALVHYAAIYGQSPVGLTANFSLNNVFANDNGENQINLTPAAVTRMQEIAWDTVQTYPRTIVTGYTNDSTIPTAPTGLTATPIGSTEVDLAWSDNAINEKGFRVEASAAGGSFEEVSVLAADATSIQVGGLDPDTAYSFRVTARNGAGTSSASTASATTGPEIGRYLQSSSVDDLLVVEAESATASQAGDAIWSGISWVTGTNTNASGDVIAVELDAAPVESASDVNTYATETPTLSYDLTFDQAGSYTLWLRADGPDAARDSVWVTLDGTVVGLTRPEPGLAWRDTGLNLNIASPGTRTLSFVMRENQTILDKFILIPVGSAFTPTGLGPAANTTTTVPDGSGGPNLLGMSFEAEEGLLGGSWRVINDPDAVADNYIEITPGLNSISGVPTDGAGIARYDFDVDTTDDYKVWVRTRAATLGDNSVYVRMNGGTWTTWNTIPTGTDFTWNAVEDTPTPGSPEVVYTLAAGTNTLEIAYREDGTQLDRIVIQDATESAPTGDGIDPPPTGSSDFVQDSSGLVSIEAENESNSADGSGKSWTDITRGDASGGTAVEAGPDTGTNINTGYTTTSPRLSYDIAFNRTGTHYVWVRATGANSGSNSLHIGLNGQAVASADRIETNTANALVWTDSTMDGIRATINIQSVGVHTLDLYMREDGVRVDKIVLTDDSTYQPVNQGPPQTLAAGQARVEAEDAVAVGPWQTLTESGVTFRQIANGTSGSPNFADPNAAPKLTFTFNASGANQNLNLRGRGDNSGDNSVWLRINGGTWQRIDFATSGLWETLNVGSGIFSGTVTVEIAQREDGTKLDWLELVDA